MTGYTADTDALHGNAPKYDAVAQKVHDIYTALSEALAAEGACWGNDDAGRAFASKYVEPALTALQQMSGTKQGLDSLVDGICSWAKNYVSADDLAAASAKQLAADASTGPAV